MPRQFNLMEIHPLLGSMLDYGDPELQSALKTLMAAGIEARKWTEIANRCDAQLAALGFPVFMGGNTKTPFDMIGDTLRGTAGIIKDLYRSPDKLLEALDRLTPVMIDLGISTAANNSSPIVFIPLHKGADGFMKESQYLKFYWPTLKKLILGLIEAGLVPHLFAEGSYNSRLEIIRDIPPGQTIWLFDRTDMLKAHEALKDKACIMGNVPSSLLATGSPAEVTEYCRNLISQVAQEGAFILSSGASVDNFKADNIRAMINAAKNC